MPEISENIRDFKGIWIPKEIYLHPDLTWTEKLLYCEINSLDGENGCFATNEYFANFLGVSQNKISVGISKLKELGLVKLVTFNGRQRVLRVVNKINTDLVEKQMQTLLKNKGRPCENHKYNNINYNNKLDIKDKNINIFTQKETNSSILDNLVMEKWNKIAEKFHLPKISRMTDERRQRLARVLKENNINLDSFFEILEDKIHKSLFLQGLKQVKDGASGWRFENADWQSNFDFYLEKGKMLKVMEDSYTDKIFLRK